MTRLIRSWLVALFIVLAGGAPAVANEAAAPSQSTVATPAAVPLCTQFSYDSYEECISNATCNLDRCLCHNGFVACMRGCGVNAGPLRVCPTPDPTCS